MEDDLLFGGQPQYHRFSPDRQQWAGSPPSCSQQDDGFRITWAPVVNSVLASCKQSTLQAPVKSKTTSVLANVKRSSASAGFPSPTRPQHASTSKASNTSLTGASDTSADTSSTSSTSAASTSSRLSKRRRRFLPSSSTPALDLDVSARNNTSHENRSHSVDDSSSDVTEMLSELARRLEANRAAAAEKERRARVPLAKKDNDNPSARPATDFANAKGKQREKIAISPAVSTVVEESMSQGMASMLLSAGTTSNGNSLASRTVMASREATSVAASTPLQPPLKPVRDMPHRSTLEDSGYTSRGVGAISGVQTSRRYSNPQAMTTSPSSQTKCFKKATSSKAVLSQSARGSQPNIAKQAPSPVKVNSLQATWQVKSTLEEDLWDENDKSLEMAMSQMDIPDPPSSQQGGRSQSTSALNLPMPPARMRQASNEPSDAKWEGFKSRDKRVREKSSDSSTASVGKLSSKPLVAVAVRGNASQPPPPAMVVTSTQTVRLPPIRTLSKSSSANTGNKPAPAATSLRPSMAPSRSFNSSTGAGLTKKFKCPTVTNTAAAKAEQDKKAAAAAKLNTRAGQPLPADEAWMEDVDWNVDDSF